MFLTYLYIFRFFRMMSPCPNKSINKKDLCTQEQAESMIIKARSAAQTLLELSNTHSTYDKPYTAIYVS